MRYLGQVGAGFIETMLDGLVYQLPPMPRLGSRFDEPQQTGAGSAVPAQQVGVGEGPGAR